MTARKTQRRKKSAAARLRPFWFLIALVAVVGAAGGYWAATWPGFYPRDVVLRGNRVVPGQEIVARAAIVGNQNLWLQNMRAAAARVAEIPYIKDVSIHRSLPATITVRVTERIPFALVRISEQSVLIDRDLRVLQSGGEGEALPVFVGRGKTAPPPGAFLKDPQAARLRDDFELLSRAHVAAATFRYDRFDDLIVSMRTGVTLLLGGDGDLAQKAALVDPILSQVAAQGKKIAEVDLRAPRTPVVVYRQK